MTVLNELIITYLKKKEELFKGFLQYDCKFLIEDDIKDVKSWGVLDCLCFIICIDNSDEKNCPWCVVMKDCNSCGYGNRHGICNKEIGNTYDRIVSDIDANLNTLRGLKEFHLYQENMRKLVKDFRFRCAIIKHELRKGDNILEVVRTLDRSILSFE